MEEFHGVPHRPPIWGTVPTPKNWHDVWLLNVAIDRLDFNRFSERGVGVSDDITCDRLILRFIHNLGATTSDNNFYIADGSRIIGFEIVYLFIGLLI